MTLRGVQSNWELVPKIVPDDFKTLTAIAYSNTCDIQQSMQAVKKHVKQDLLKGTM